MRASLTFASMMLVLSWGTASAGVVITFSQTDLSSKKSTPVTIYADPDKMAIVTAEDTVIYRDDQKKFWIVDPARKNYTEITPETVQQLTGQMAAMQAQMQAQLSALPPAQRAQMEAMMAGLGLSSSGAAAKPPELRYARQAQTKRIANFPCTMYSRTRDGEHDQDVCIATMSAAGLTEADFKVLDSFDAIAEKLTAMPGGPRKDEFSWAAMNRAIGFAGVPLETSDYQDGKASTQTTVQKIERTTIPASTFQVPAGFARETISINP